MTIDYGGVLYHVAEDGSVLMERAGQPPAPVDEGELPAPVLRVLRRVAEQPLRRRRFEPRRRTPWPWAQPPTGP